MFAFKCDNRTNCGCTINFIDSELTKEDDKTQRIP